MAGEWDVLGMGAVAVDDLVYVERYPAPDSKQPILGQVRQGGGLAGTALVAAARLGGRAGYCGVLDTDDLSTFTIRELEREGVDCHSCITLDGARPVHSIIVVDQSTGSRVILHSHAGVMQPDPEALAPDLLATCRVLFVDHLVIDTALALIPGAHSRGVQVVADVEDEQHPQLERFLQGIDHLIVGIELAGRLTGENDPAEMTATLAQNGRRCSVVTAGARGCWYCERGGSVQHFPAFCVPVVDTTGCGDVFHGAYMISIARGETAPRAIHIASATAALKATRAGGRDGIPDLPTVLRYLHEHGYPKV